MKLKLMNVHTHKTLCPNRKQVSCAPTHTVPNMSHKHLKTGLCAAAEIPIILCSESGRGGGQLAVVLSRPNQL